MPHTHPTASATGLPPVPVAVLLPPSIAGRNDDLSDWHGVGPRDAAALIARYTRPSDLVIELDAHQTITQAARHLGRRPTSAVTVGDVAARPPHRPLAAGVILAALPRSGLNPCDLAAASGAMQTWRTWLRPGGYLLIALKPPGEDACRQQRPVSHRATVIAAARTAGFTWQQEFLVLTAPPPEHEPRAEPDTSPAIPSALVNGRHRSAHVKVLAFRHQAGGTDA
jgi:hypothetical protein